jgi:hypothetical protein
MGCMQIMIFIKKNTQNVCYCVCTFVLEVDLMMVRYGFSLKNKL